MKPEAKPDRELQLQLYRAMLRARRWGAWLARTCPPCPIAPHSRTGSCRMWSASQLRCGN